jgi:hypothetical protein
MQLKDIWTTPRRGITMTDTGLGESVIHPDLQFLCQVLCLARCRPYLCIDQRFDCGQSDSEGQISLSVDDLVPLWFDEHVISEMGHIFRVQVRVQMDHGKWVEWTSKDISVEK